MGTAYVLGFRAALRRWPVVLLLFVASLLTGLGFAAASWSWLAAALADSLATRTLLTDLDLNVFVDLFMHHGESLRVLLAGAALFGLLIMFLGIWLNAVAIAAVGEDTGLHASMRRGLDVYPRYVALWLVANVVHGVSVALAYVLGRGLTHWLAESPNEMTFYWSVASSAALGAALLLFSTTVHDHARIHCVATDSSAPRAYLWALGYVGRHERRALVLALLLLTTGVVVWGIYQAVGMLIHTNSTTGVTVSLVWGQALLLVRMFGRLWCFAAETELQNISDQTPD